MVAIDLIVQHVHSQLEEVRHQQTLKEWRPRVSNGCNFNKSRNFTKNLRR